MFASLYYTPLILNFKLNVVCVYLEPDHKKNGSRPAVPPKPELTSTLKPSTDPVSLAKLSSHFASLNSVEKLKREFDVSRKLRSCF